MSISYLFMVCGKFNMTFLDIVIIIAVNSYSN